MVINLSLNLGESSHAEYPTLFSTLASSIMVTAIIMQIVKVKMSALRERYIVQSRAVTQLLVP